jgi:hypothetical protein
LEFAKLGSLNVDLTGDILNFQGTVKSEGVKRGLYSEGMEVDARYVRRKDLNQYLPASVLGKKTREGDGENRKRKKTNSVSEDSKKRKLEDVSTSLNGSTTDDSFANNSQDASNSSDLLDDSASEPVDTPPRKIMSSTVRNGEVC